MFIPCSFELSHSMLLPCIRHCPYRYKTYRFRRHIYVVDIQFIRRQCAVTEPSNKILFISDPFPSPGIPRGGPWPSDRRCHAPVSWIRVQAVKGIRELSLYVLQNVLWFRTTESIGFRGSVSRFVIKDRSDSVPSDVLRPVAVVGGTAHRIGYFRCPPDKSLTSPGGGGDALRMMGGAVQSHEVLLGPPLRQTRGPDPATGAWDIHPLSLSSWVGSKVSAIF